jgi:hypothetical protein
LSSLVLACIHYSVYIDHPLRLISPIITLIIRRSQYVDFLLRTAPAASPSPSPRRHRPHDNVKSPSRWPLPEGSQDGCSECSAPVSRCQEHEGAG